jgi:hypothetical protein
MGFWSWLIRSGQSHRGKLRGNGSFDLQIVGEGSYQAELEKIVGGKTEDSCEHACEALLVPELRNRHDPNAVYVEISGRKVGYLSRPLAAEYRQRMKVLGVDGPMRCDAMIVGGWCRPDGDEGSFGVRLDLRWPAETL